MSIQNVLTAALFKRDDAGRTVVFPNGAAGRGYFVPDAATEQKLRRKLMWAIVAAGLLGGIGMQIMLEAAALRRNSREIVDGDRPIRSAIMRILTPSARITAICSRSEKQRYLPDTGVKLDRWHTASVTEPPRPHGTRHAARHRRIFARKALGDLPPECPLKIPAYRRPSR